MHLLLSLYVYILKNKTNPNKQVGKRSTFKLITSVTVGPNGEIIVADSRIQVFSAKGDFSEEIYSEGKGETQLFHFHTLTEVFTSYCAY